MDKIYEAYKGQMAINKEDILLVRENILNSQADAYKVLIVNCDDKAVFKGYLTLLHTNSGMDGDKDILANFLLSRQNGRYDIRVGLKAVSKKTLDSIKIVTDVH